MEHEGLFSCSWHPESDESSLCPDTVCLWRSILMFLSLLCLCLSSGLISSYVLAKIFSVSHVCHAYYMPHQSHPSWFDHFHNTCWRVHIMNLHSSLFSNTLSPCFFFFTLGEIQGFTPIQKAGKIIAMCTFIFMFLDRRQEDQILSWMAAIILWI